MHRGVLQVTEMPLDFQGTEGYLQHGNYLLLSMCLRKIRKFEGFFPLKHLWQDSPDFSRKVKSCNSRLSIAFFFEKRKFYNQRGFHH